MPRRKQHGVTLIALLLALILLLIGVAVAWYAGNRLGWLGSVVGFFIGSLGSYAVLLLTVYLAALVSALFTGMPWFPACGTGRCKSGLLADLGDYTFEQINDHFGVRCRCGLVYVRPKDTRQVLECCPDGTLRPYMIWKPLRGWYPDEQESP